jgi:hypothetical protein
VRAVKLRIKGNTLRLRLTQGEMRSLSEHGAVEDRTEFPGGAALVYRLKVDEKKTEITARYIGYLVEILVPRALVDRWHGSDLVTLSAAQPLPAGELAIVLEKDFACLAPREGEDESDNFPHPLAGGVKSC